MTHGMWAGMTVTLQKDAQEHYSKSSYILKAGCQVCGMGNPVCTVTQVSDSNLEGTWNPLGAKSEE